MALLEIEGFEARSLRNSWFFNSGSLSNPGTGRFGGICASSGHLSYASPVLVDEIVMGWAWNLKTGTTRVEIFASSGSSMILEPNNERRLRIIRGNTTLVTSEAPLPVGSWIYMEVRARLADVGGYVEVRANGATIASFVGDTLNTGTDTKIARVQFYNMGEGYVDDVYVCDRTGSEFNDFLGEIQVEGLVPNGNGSNSQWVGSDGNSIDNYLLVDETPAVETDLVRSDVVGAKDTYQFTNLTVAGGVILAIQPSISISKDNAGPAAARIVERLANGTERKSAPFLATNLTTWESPVLTRAPDGGIWTVASINAAEFGVEVA